MLTRLFSNSLTDLVAIIAGFRCTGAANAVQQAKANRVASPNGRLAVDFRLNDVGAPRYAVRLDDRAVLRESRLGLARDDGDFSAGLRLVSASRTAHVRERYEILTAKRRVNSYQANRKEFHLETVSGQKLDIIFQVSNDGLAFRYFFPDASAEKRRLNEEHSSFHLLPGTRAWLQPMSVAKSGWEKTNPSYEEFYEQDIPVGAPSPTGAGWVYPALFRSGECDPQKLHLTRKASIREYARPLHGPVDLSQLERWYWLSL